MTEGSSLDDLCVCGADRGAHKIIHSHVFIGEDPPEPKASASSSPDDECEICGHYRSTHGFGACLACRFPERHHPFAPADAETAGTSWVSWEETKRQAAETAGEPEAPGLKPCEICGDRRKTNEQCSGFTLCEPCIYSEGQPYCGGCGSSKAPFALVKGEQRNELRCLVCCTPEPKAPTAAQEAAMQELTDLRQEMEAEPCTTQFPEGQCAGTRRHPGDCTPNADDIALPEPEALVCVHDTWEHDAQGVPQRCRDCGFEPESPGSPEPPRRPPYAVAYATEGGAQYEIALPGDATIRAEAGALIITHASAVLALTQARPMEAP